MPEVQGRIRQNQAAGSGHIQRGGVAVSMPQEQWYSVATYNGINGSMGHKEEQGTRK